MSQDAVSTEIFANLFKAVVDEMAWILLRSSHTTFVKETQDFAVALVTPEGETFAYPYGSGATPIMGVPMHAGTKAVTDWVPGDVLMTNDPYSTGGMVMHLNDIYLFQPIFADGALLCFAWCFIHCTDVGGYAPGSIDMQNNEVFQEGLRLRPMRLYRAGVLNTELWNIFADNCRIPALNWGDITACVSSLNKAAERMQRLTQRYGRDAVTTAIAGTLDRTEQITREVLARIPAGEYRFTEFFEDDYISDLPVRLALRLVSHGDGRVTLDYTGSDPQVRAALNLPAGSMKHHPFLSLGLTNFVVTKSDSIHINAGIQRCIDLVLPEASVVNARFPAACGMRFTTAMRVHDLVVGALIKALPGEVPAGGGNTLVVSYISTSELGETGRVVVANPVTGGSAGGPDRDGISGTDFSVAFLRNVPVEVLESEVPVLVHRYSLVPDSEGAGQFRGGFGVAYDVEIRHPSAVVVMRGKDRFRFGSWGAFGGGGGAVNGNVGQRGDAVHDIGKRTVYRPEMGEIIRLWSGGGGGYGDPLTRDPALVARDVADDLISLGRAHGVYGVVMCDGAVDVAATERHREQLATTRDAPAAYDFGPGRTEWERIHGAAAELIAAWMPSLPAGVRRYAQARVYRYLHEAGPGPYDAVAVQPVLQRLETELSSPR
ncbi:MAG TPA: hydantoinase B/oxoprolinase family protein [Acetobacteraceae bacterium]|jgi:N-methylhydantoinase B|nr:hydantoinase B/oxoprolinase family protein [Acetobacteraceae bacterium]